MNRSLVGATSALVLLLASSSACAWDPDSSSEDPFLDGPEATAWAPEPAPVSPPEGIYLVTETYVDDVVVRNGPVTTYRTETVHETTGSYARVLESVPTGARSGYDGSAFNGRAELGDGRSVAGTYYENYIRTDGGYTAVSIVFFQDDEEIARAQRSTARISQPQPAPDPVPQAALVRPASSPSGAVTPLIEVPGSPRTSLEERAITVPISVPGQTAPVGLVRLPDRVIEVLRARRIGLSLGGGDVVAWRFVSGEGVALGPVSGRGVEQFFVRWDRLAPPGQAWVTRFLIDLADGTTRELTVRVTVRAPGLVE